MIHDKLQRLGSWNITVSNLPTDTLAKLEWFGRVLVIPGLVADPETRTAADLAAMARYGGILRHKQVQRNDPASVVLSGPGMAVLLGDEDNKGPVIIEDEVSGVTYAAAVNDLVSAKLSDGDLLINTGGSVTTPGGASNVTAAFEYVTLREAIDYLAGMVDAYWRVNPDATLDTGADTDLFTTDPEVVIVRRTALRGGTLEARTAQGRLLADQAADDYTTKVLMVGEAANKRQLEKRTEEALSFPYTGPNGAQYKVTRMIREETTDANTIEARAQLQLNRFNRLRQAVTLRSSTHDIVGRAAVGDTVYVYDPDTGLVGSEELDHQGTLITPMELQVTGLSWPVHEGHTVVYVHGDGTVTDLTPWVDWETGDTEVEVGEYPRTLSSDGINAVAASVADATAETDSTAPAQVVLGTILTGTYRGPEGVDLAYLIVPWTEPLDGDGGAVEDGAHYEVQWRETGGSEWRSTFYGWGETSAELQALATDTSHDIRVRAVDTSGNRGTWSATSVAVTSVDNIPPSTPAAPTVAGNPLSILVTHDLQKASTGDLEADTALLEVHVGTSSGFTPSTSTLVGEIPVGGALQAGISVVGSFPTFTDATRYTKVIAVDRAGNRSTASASASVTADLIDSSYISSLTADLITTGTMNAARINGGDINGVTITGVTITGGTITGTTIQTATSGRHVRITSTGIDFYSATSTLRARLDVTGSTVSFDSAGSGSGLDISFESIELSPQIGNVVVNLAPSGLYQLLLDRTTLTAPTSANSGPHLARQGDDDTGFYWHGTNQSGMAAGGTPAVVGTSTGVAFNNGLITDTGTTDARIKQVSVNGVTMWALRRPSSRAANKLDQRPFTLTRDEYGKLQPKSWVWRGAWFDKHGRPGGAPSKAEDPDGLYKGPPKGAKLQRRAGLVWEDTVGVDLHLVTDVAIDWEGVAAATVDQTQQQWSELDRLAARIAALEEAAA